MKEWESGQIQIMGHVHIEDDLGHILLDKCNAVHPENMSLILARGLARESNYYIWKMVLGNGGASISSTDGSITYLSPNTTGDAADVYNETYSEIVDDVDVGVGSSNSVTAASGSGTTSVVTVGIELQADEPASQPSTDVGPSSENDFAFDELGLKSEDGKLLTHVIFSPILKSANRSISITYTLTITVS